MSKLQIQYSKEIAKELGKIAVYFPGEHIEVGDIIKFPFGKSLFGKSKPLGTFQKITSLKKIGIQYDEPQFSNSPDTYHFTSKNAIEFKSDIETNLSLGTDNLPNAKSALSIEFSSEGAIYFLAIDCDKKELNDLLALEKEINVKGKKMLWYDTYLVTSVTIAKKALILQSRSKSSGIIIEGNIQGINSGNVNIANNARVNLKNQKGDVFIKNWSDDVTVFMDVVKFEKEIFEAETNHRIAKKEAFRIHIKKVSIEEVLED